MLATCLPVSVKFKSIIDRSFDLSFSTDTGGDCETVCTVINAFARKCQSLLGMTINWRSQMQCPIQCESGKIYMACGPRCPQTCFPNENNTQCQSDSECTDGCFCPNGQVLDPTGQCVQPEQCPCLHANKIYSVGSHLWRPSNDGCEQQCRCLNGSFVCEECLSSNCTENQFSCTSNNQCIPLRWYCDGVSDCLDGSDEIEQNCQQRCLNITNRFRCSNKQCIDSRYRCDGSPDCRDASDELNCCKSLEKFTLNIICNYSSFIAPHNLSCHGYTCRKSKKCIPKDWLCDGTMDCGQDDGSDEAGPCR